MEYTEELLQRKKACNLMILKDFDYICKSQGLEYIIAYGTTLGAVRHGGFIPWDDDIDVHMCIGDLSKLRHNWKKFCKCNMHVELANKYFLQWKHSDPNVPGAYYRLRLNGTTSIGAGELNIPMHCGVSLDIFPIYSLPNNKLFQKIQRKVFFLTENWCGFSFYHFNSNSIKKFVYRFLALIGMNLLFIFSCLSSKSEYYFVPTRSDKNKNVKKNVIFPSKDIKFENLFLPAPHDTDTYLKSQYGDYMTLPPIEDRVCHPHDILDFDKDYTYYVNKF